MLERAAVVIRVFREIADVAEEIVAEPAPGPVSSHPDGAERSDPCHPPGSSEQRNVGRHGGRERLLTPKEPDTQLDHTGPQVLPPIRRAAALSGVGFPVCRDRQRDGGTERLLRWCVARLHE